MLSLHGSLFQVTENESEYNSKEEMLIEMILNFDEFQITNHDIKQVVEFLINKIDPENLISLKIAQYR